MFYLTSQERKTIVFVLCLLILGIGLDFFKKKTNRTDLINYEVLEDRLFKKVDINKASISELTTIPGVGKKLAYSIVDFRKFNRGFRHIEELKKIRGIKDKKLKQLKKYITLEDHSR